MVRHAKRERGASAVEFAILLPVLLLVIAGIVDLGRFLFTQISLTNAAREGARAAVVSSANLSGIQSRVSAAAPGMALTTTASLCAPGSTQNSSVTTSTNFSWIMLGPALSLVGASQTLPQDVSATAVMRCGG